MTTKAFANRMNRVLENAQYFALIGYHCSLHLSASSETCVLTVFYDDKEDEEFIIGSSDLTPAIKESEGTKWITLS